MDLAKRAAQATAWARAPRLMFTRRKPKRAALLAAASRLTDRVRPARRSRTSFGRTAAQGLGAAAVAIPVGLWVGRRAMGDDEGTRPR